MTTLEVCDRIKPDTSNICTNELPPNDNNPDRGFVTRQVPNSCTCFQFKHAKLFLAESPTKENHPPRNSESPYIVRHSTFPSPMMGYLSIGVKVSRCRHTKDRYWLFSVNPPPRNSRVSCTHIALMPPSIPKSEAV